MKKLHVFGAGLMLCFVTTANAALSYVDSSGNPASAPAVLDSSNEAIYFSEIINEFGEGQYTVTNNTVGYELMAFGISNADTLAWVGSIGSNFGCGFGCYQSDNLDEFNWGTTPIDFNGNTGMDIFGNISNVLGAGDTTLNFYMSNDGSLASGDSWDQFLFSGLLASQLFVVLQDVGGTTVYASGGQPINAVPLPAAVWLFGSGLLGLAGLAGRKKA